MAQLPHYILNIDNLGELGIEETSFVEYPATGLSFLAFEDEKVEHKFAKLNEKYDRMVSGVLMIPDTKYLRATKEGEFYTVEFKAETLKNAMINYLKQNKQNNVKVEHKGANLQGFSAVEHWIIEDANTKSPILGLSLEDLGYEPTTIPTGTIMKTTYIEDESFFNDMILSGKVQGYSIGGMFEMEQVETEVQEFRKTTDLPTISDVLRAIGISAKEVTVIDKNGAELTFGEVVKDGDKVAEGTFEFSDNLVVVIKEGVIVDYGFQEGMSNYPQAAKDNAKRAIEANEKNGNKCATQTGKVRAQQIANGESLSMETIKRTFSYLSRAKEYDKNDWDSCGTISYNLWGGDEMLRWTEKVLNSKEEKFNNETTTNAMETQTTPEVQPTEVVVEAPEAVVADTVETTEPTIEAPVVTETPEVNVPQVQNQEQAVDINAKLADYDSKLADLTSKLEDVLGKLSNAQKELENKAQENANLKNKLQEQPIKKESPLKTLGNQNKPTGGTQLRIGNKTVNI